MKHPHNELSQEQIIEKIKKDGFMGRHKYKTMNNRINKKLRRMVREGILEIWQSDARFSYYILKGVPLKPWMKRFTEPKHPAKESEL